MSRTQRFSFLRKKATIRPVFHSSGTGGKVSPGSRRFSAPLRCMCDWVERDLTGCQIFLGSAGVIDFPVQFLPMYITLAFQERRGNSLTAIHRPYQGGLIIMISLHFPSLLVMRNESSFGEKKGECSGGGGELPPPPNRRDERGDGRRAVHRRRNVRFISEVCAGSFAVLHIRRWWIIEELWAHQLFTLRKMEESWQNVLIALLTFSHYFGS